MGRALRREFTSLRRRRTHPALLPLWALDRIYWDHAVRGESLRVHRTRLARVASDHLPLVASLRLRPAVAPGPRARVTLSSPSDIGVVPSRRVAGIVGRVTDDDTATPHAGSLGWHLACSMTAHERTPQ